MKTVENKFCVIIASKRNSFLITSLKNHDQKVDSVGYVRYLLWLLGGYRKRAAPTCPKQDPLYNGDPTLIPKQKAFPSLLSSLNSEAFRENDQRARERPCYMFPGKYLIPISSRFIWVFSVSMANNEVATGEIRW